MKLLCIVDMQQGLLTPEIQPVILNCEKLAEEFCQSKQPVFCSRLLNNTGSPFERYLDCQRLMDKQGQQLFSGVAHYANKTFVKYGYSVWTPAFAQAVKNKQISQIYFSGLDTDACILSSALEAFDRGIEPFVIEDACTSTGGNDYHNIGLACLARNIGDKRIVKTQEVIEDMWP